jgi:hypothetical protein
LQDKGRDYAEDLGVYGRNRMGLREIGWRGVDWMHLAQDRDRWWAVVNTEIKFLVPYTAGNFLAS